MDSGCEWEGTVGTLEDHVTTCGFTLVPCPRECKDDDDDIQHFANRDLDEHLRNACPYRDYQCRQCGEKATYSHIIHIHSKICKNKLILCPNFECTETVQRQGVKRHLESCKFTEVACKYLKLGCDVTMMRKCISAHENEDKLHLRMALDKIVAMEQKVDGLEEEVRDGGRVALRSGESLTFKVTEYETRKDCEELYESPKFYTLEGYHMEVKVYANGIDNAEGTHVSVFARVVEGKYDDTLKWPFVGNVTCCLLNQLEDHNHHEITIPFEQEDNHLVGGTMTGVLRFIRHSKLAHDPSRNSQYLKDDTLYFRVSVDIPDSKPWLQCTPAVLPITT